jgi:hypothetical protein
MSEALEIYTCVKQSLGVFGAEKEMVVVVQLISPVLFVTPWTTACQASLFLTISHYLHSNYLPLSPKVCSSSYPLSQ